jgi:hypothetical protein
MPTIEEYARIYNLTSTPDGKIKIAGFREIFDSGQVLSILLELQHRKRLKVLVPDVWLPIAPALGPDTVRTVLGDQHQNARSSVCSDSVRSERVVRDMGRRDTTMHLRPDPNLPPPPSSTPAQKLSEPKLQGESESIYNLKIVNEQAKIRQCLPRAGLMQSPIANQRAKVTSSDNVTKVNTDRRSTKNLGFDSVVTYRSPPQQNYSPPNDKTGSRQSTVKIDLTPVDMGTKSHVVNINHSPPRGEQQNYAAPPVYQNSLITDFVTVLKDAVRQSDAETKTSTKQIPVESQLGKPECESGQDATTDISAMKEVSYRRHHSVYRSSPTRGCNNRDPLGGVWDPYRDRSHWEGDGNDTNDGLVSAKMSQSQFNQTLGKDRELYPKGWSLFTQGLMKGGVSAWQLVGLPVDTSGMPKAYPDIDSWDGVNYPWDQYRVYLLQKKHEMSWTDLQTGVVFQTLLRGSVKQKAMISAGLAHPNQFNLYACMEFFNAVYGTQSNDPQSRRILRGLLTIMHIGDDESENAFAERIQETSFLAYAGSDPRERMESELLTFMNGIRERNSQMLLQKAYRKGTIGNITQALQELRKLTPTTLRDLDPGMVGPTAPYNKKNKGKTTGIYPGIYATANKVENNKTTPDPKVAPVGSTPSGKKPDQKVYPDRTEEPRFRRLSQAEKERLDALTSSECNRLCITCGATGHLPSECFGRESDTKKLHACRGRRCKKEGSTVCKCKCGGHFGEAASPKTK